MYNKQLGLLLADDGGKTALQDGPSGGRPGPFWAQNWPKNQIFYASPTYITQKLGYSELGLKNACWKK